MKMITINAYTYAETVAIAATKGLKIVRNVTPSYKNADCPNGQDLIDFGISMLEKNKLDGVTGVGVMCVIEDGKPDTRERPYTFKDCPSSGERTKTRMYVVRTKDTDHFVGKAPDKGSAVKLAKAAMSEYKENMICTIMYEVSDPEAFTLEYTPTTGTKMGTYVAFGVPTIE